MRTEVTTARYLACHQAGACDLPSPPHDDCTLLSEQTDDLELPVNCMSWNNARQFARWFGHDARLPTEAEWTFAATSGTDRAFPWGNETPTCERVVREWDFDTPGTATHCSTFLRPPCSRVLGNTPPPRVLCDLSGNVGELLEDDFFPTLDCTRPPLDDPSYRSSAELCEGATHVPLDGSAWVSSAPRTAKLAKGGGFRDGGEVPFSVWHRTQGSLDYGNGFSGFRLVIPDASAQP